jgi:hypothetical protein
MPELLSPVWRAIQMRWSGAVPVSTLFWRDMIGVGTAVNAIVLFIALMFYAQGYSAIAVAIHFATLPYNLFLWMCIWRAPVRSLSVCAWSTIWFGVVVVA